MPLQVAAKRAVGQGIAEQLIKELVETEREITRTRYYVSGNAGMQLEKMRIEDLSHRLGCKIDSISGFKSCLIAEIHSAAKRLAIYEQASQELARVLGEQRSLSWAKVIEAIISDFDTSLPKSIAAGVIAERFIRSGELDAIAEESLDQLYAITADLLRGTLGAKAEFALPALQLYAVPNGIIMHMRHNAAKPESFTGHGALFYEDENGYVAHHESKDREKYGHLVDGVRRTQIVKFPSQAKMRDYAHFLASKNWYTNFLDPSLEGKIPRFPYVLNDGFLSWKERAAAAEDHS